VIGASGVLFACFLLAIIDLAGYCQDMKVQHQMSHYNNTIKMDRRFIHVLSMILAAESIPLSMS
jgi:hypothetical protein